MAESRPREQAGRPDASPDAQACGAPQYSDDVVAQLNTLSAQIEQELYALREYDGPVSTVSITSSHEHTRPRRRRARGPPGGPGRGAATYLVRDEGRSAARRLRVEEGLVCGVCLEPLQKPVALPCGHAFCAACVHAASRLWSPKRCPRCAAAYGRFPGVAVDLERRVFAALRMGRRPLRADLVRVLVSRDRVPALAFGVVEAVSDPAAAGAQEAVVETGARKWAGRAADLEVVDPCRYAPGTRALRGALLVHQKSVRPRPAADVVCCNVDFLPAAGRRPGEPGLRPNMSLGHMAGPAAEPEGGPGEPRPAAPPAGQRIREFLGRLSRNAEAALSQECVYDPLVPKQQPPVYTPYCVQNAKQVSILLADEAVLGHYVLLGSDMVQREQPDLHQYMRLITDFQHLTKTPQFCCNGCKLLLRVPVTLECGCQYCCNCANELARLQNVNQCLGCGAQLSKRLVDIQSQISKKLIMRMYAKLPRHTPQIDRGLPVRLVRSNTLGILLDDPERVNVWVMTGPGQSAYVHQSEIRSFNMCQMQFALRVAEGLAYYNGQFIFLRQEATEGASSYEWKIYGLDSYRGQIVSNVESLCYHCLRPVEDMRERFVVAKLEGTKIQQQEREKRYRKLKLEELKKEEAEQENKTAIQKDVEEQREQRRARAADAKQQKLIDEQVRERRKKLGLVAYDNPDAKNHPGNIMVYQAGRRATGDVQGRITGGGGYFQSYTFRSKPAAIQLCYLYPKLNVLCSACWNVLKRPVCLPCGHIVCRTCACVYQAGAVKCLPCKASVGCILDCKEDTKLTEELYSIDEQYTDRQLDVGAFVVAEGESKLGIVAEFRQQGTGRTFMVAYGGHEAQWFPAGQLTMLRAARVVERDLGVNSPCMVATGKCRGIMGLVLGASQDQNGVRCRQARQQYGADDGCVVLRVLLETGCPGLFPVSALRKVELEVEPCGYQQCQDAKRAREAEAEEQMLESVRREISQMTVAEKAEFLGHTPKEPCVSKNVWGDV